MSPFDGLSAGGESATRIARKGPPASSLNSFCPARMSRGGLAVAATPFYAACPVPAWQQVWVPEPHFRAATRIPPRLAAHPPIPVFDQRIGPLSAAQGLSGACGLWIRLEDPNFCLETPLLAFIRLASGVGTLLPRTHAESSTQTQSISHDQCAVELRRVPS